MSPEVQSLLLELVHVILDRLDQTVSEGGKLVVGQCSDGLVLIFPARSLMGGERMNLIRVTEEDLLKVGSDTLWAYYTENKDGKQSIEDFALAFKAGWNDAEGKLLN